MPRPTSPPPPPDQWYPDNSPRPVPGDIAKTCPTCGRTFYTLPQTKRDEFPAIQEPTYCSRSCKTTAQNQRYHQRHKETK